MEGAGNDGNHFVLLHENVEHVDWIDADELDLDGVDIPNEEEDLHIPILSVEEAMRLPWEDGAQWFVLIFVKEISRFNVFYVTKMRLNSVFVHFNSHNTEYKDQVLINIAKNAFSEIQGERSENHVIFRRGQWQNDDALQGGWGG